MVRERIFEYGMQRGAGLRVRVSRKTAQPGASLLMSAWFHGPIVIGLRAVGEADPRRLRLRLGYPESGEELFSVELRPGGEVVGAVSTLSRPGRWYTRLAAPVGRALQRVMTRRYLAAAAR